MITKFAKKKYNQTIIEKDRLEIYFEDRKIYIVNFSLLF